MDERLRLIDAFLGSRIGRREFMAKAAALGISVPAVAAFGRSAHHVAAQDTPVQGGRIIIATKEEPGSMDNHVDSAPASGVIYDNIYDQLTVIDPEGQIHPGLAERWETVEPTRWRIYLRQGVMWHNGETFTADDLKYHFDRIFNPDDPGRPAGLLAPYQSCEVVDDYTLDILTDQPYPLLMNDLAPRWQSISTNKTQIEAVGAANYGQDPVGTGPFKFKSWEVGGSLILEANDEYWDGRPYLDEVEFRAIPEDSSRLLAFESGEVDFIYVVPRFEVPRLQDDDNYTVLEAVTFVTSYITINCAKPPFDDVRVRQAIGHAVNKEDLVAIAFEGQATVADQLIAPGVLGYNPELETAWPFDPEQAQALLEEAGWVAGGEGIREKDGQKLSGEFHFSVGSRFPEGVAEIIQSNMRDIGFDLVLMQRESSVISAELPEGLIPLNGGATGLGTGNFGQLNYEHFHSKGGRSYNFLWEVDPEAQAELDAIVEAATVEYDEARRMELWGQVMEFNRAQALKIPMYYPKELGATRKAVRDAYLHPGEYLRMKRVWIAQD
jgi:peptide/nickel transport system substrate-binding protein